MPHPLPSVLLLLATLAPAAFAQQLPPAEPAAATVPPLDSKPHSLLDRTYTAGKTLMYQMKGSNQDWHYSLLATDHIRQDATGGFYEEIGWSDLQSSQPITLSPADLDFRQTLSLAPPGKYLAVPDLRKLSPWLIGPITDLLTFYSDRYLAQQFHLTRPGQHSYFAYGKPNSWADGRHTLLGQDSIDFKVTLQTLDSDAHTATLLVQHLPPRYPQIKLPADWMQPPIAATPNNWVQVQTAPGGYLAQVGQELFEDTLIVDTTDGKLLSVRMHNPITATQRTCQDAALTQCGPATSLHIVRDISLELLP